MTPYNGKKKFIKGGHPISVAVIGGGAAGALAAYAAASRGAEVILLDRNDRIGRKIYATGNGRCNITNRKMTQDCYYSTLAERIPDYYRRFAPDDLLKLFERYGIFFHDRNGYVYPRTDQASTIAHALEKMLSSAGVSFCPMTEVSNVAKGRNKDRNDDGAKDWDRNRNENQIEDARFLISGRKSEYTIRKGKLRILDAEPFSIETDRVILTAGGMAAPAYGSRGDSYRFAAGFGHTVISPEPALVPLISSDPVLKYASGVRCQARAELHLGEKILRSEEGEIQFSENHISGIPILQLSRLAVNLLTENENEEQNGDRREIQEGHQKEHHTYVHLLIDFLPEFTKEQWEAEKKRRLSALSDNPDSVLGELFLGLVNDRVGNMILARRGQQAEKKCRKTDPSLPGELLNRLRAWVIPVSGYGSFDQAQTTAGGVPLSELTENLESIKVPGLYMAGEMLDVDGICGGYNLTWAMISGYLAGCAAAGMPLERESC